MYLFFLIVFVLVSMSLIFLILFQPGKVFNNENSFDTKNNITFFNHLGINSLTTKIIGVFSFLFFFTSIILCSINSRQINVDHFWDEQRHDILKKDSFLNKKTLNSDIPH